MLVSILQLLFLPFSPNRKRKHSIAEVVQIQSLLCLHKIEIRFNFLKRRHHLMYRTETHPAMYRLIMCLFVFAISRIFLFQLFLVYDLNAKLNYMDNIDSEHQNSFPRSTYIDTEELVTFLKNNKNKVTMLSLNCQSINFSFI